MINIKRHFKIWILVYGVLFTSCSITKMWTKPHEQIFPEIVCQINPDTLVAGGGFIDFDLLLSIAQYSMPRTQIIRVTPIVSYANNVNRLKSIYIQGQYVQQTPYNKVKHNASLQLIEQYRIQCPDSIDKLKIECKIEYSDRGTCIKLNDALVYDDTLINTSKLIPTITSQTEKLATIEIPIVLYFTSSNSTIVGSPEYLQILKEQVDSLRTIEMRELTNVELVVSCSPDGLMSYNEALGVKRMEKAYSFFESHFNLNEYRSWNCCNQQIIAQNWDGLYRLLESSNIEEREKVIHILQNSKENVRIQLLKRYQNQYPMINQYLSSLRYAMLILRYN